MLRFKICGIVSLEDALLAIDAGAYAIGFIFVKKSPRYIHPESAKKIICSIPPFVQTVGVFLDEDPTTVKEICDFCGLDMIQFHGNESPEICRSFMPKSIKAIRVKDKQSIEKIAFYKGCVRAILLDTYKKEKAGGTGESFDWALAVEAKRFGLPIILSGGIGPDNIRDAVSIVKPFAVDVNSKVEIRPGKKSAELIKKLRDALNINDRKKQR